MLSENQLSFGFCSISFRRTSSTRPLGRNGIDGQKGFPGKDGLNGRNGQNGIDRKDLVQNWKERAWDKISDKDVNQLFFIFFMYRHAYSRKDECPQI